jgi:hypothetical protein
MKSTFLFAVAVAGGAFGATPAVSQPSQQVAVIPPELFQLSLEPQLVAPATQSSTPLFIGHRQETVSIDRRQVTVNPLPPGDYSVELSPLARLHGDLIDDRR